MSKIDYQIYKDAAKAYGFYEIPIWDESKPKPSYFDLFKWIKGWNGMTLNDPIRYGGSLNEELFDTIDKKIAYLQGVFDDYSGSAIKRGENTLHFANSQNKVERCKKWLQDVADYMNSLDGRVFKPIDEFIFHAVSEHNISYTCPICHTIKINPKVVKYIQEFKYE